MKIKLQLDLKLKRDLYNNILLIDQLTVLENYLRILNCFRPDYLFEIIYIHMNVMYNLL